MKIGICDDLATEREVLKKYCNQLGYNDIIFFTSGEELLKSTELLSLHLLFLDIEMDGMSGIETKNVLEKLSPFTLIAFCTTHQEMMPDAFGHNVISFQYKPISKLSVEHCIRRAAFLTRNFSPIAIDDTTRVPCANILYLQSEQKYTIFYTKNGESFSSRKTLKEWTTELAEFDFCAISRSAVINLKHYLKTENKQVLLHEGISLPISRRYVQTLEKAFQAYLLTIARNN